MVYGNDWKRQRGLVIGCAIGGLCVGAYLNGVWAGKVATKRESVMSYNNNIT